MKKGKWLKSEKIDFFKEKKDMPKKKRHDDDFSPKKALKIAGGLAVLGVGINLATELID